MSSAFGTGVLFAAFLASGLSAACLLAVNVGSLTFDGAESRRERVAVAGFRAARLSGALAALAMALLMACFLLRDVSVLFIAENLSDASGLFGALSRMSGAWSGQQGSIMTWAVMIALFGAAVARVGEPGRCRVDEVALLVVQAVLLAFLGACCFAPGCSPFESTPTFLLAGDGGLSEAAAAYGLGMGDSLKHWAMLLHPPLLFAGYAGFAVPFAYAAAALVVGDLSPAWVVRARPFALASFGFLALGVLLGSVWAADTAGWGGWWAWDPVENAGLLPCVACVGFLHSAAMYGRDRSFGMWAVFFAAACFSLVLFGAFVARSGLVGSIHAYAGVNLGFAAFLIAAAACLLAFLLGLFARRRSFGEADGAPFGASSSVLFFGNVLTLLLCAVLAYLTCSSALPGWMPFGGSTPSSAAFDALAVPLAVALVVAIAAIIVVYARGGQRPGGSFFAVHLAAAAVATGYAANVILPCDALVAVVWVASFFLAASLLHLGLRR